MNEHPAGWHPDPAGSGRLRWWDGNQWTEHFQDMPAGSEPAPAGVASRAGEFLKGMVDRSADEFPDDGLTIWAATSKTLTGLGGGRYRLTSEYLYFEKGIVSTDAQQLPVGYLYDIDASQSITQRARGVGTITIMVRRPDGAPEKVRLEDVPDFREGVQKINAAARAERERLQTRANTQNFNYSGMAPIASAPAVAPAVAAASASSASASAPVSIDEVMATIEKLGLLRDAGHLTPEEFEAKKAELLARI